MRSRTMVITRRAAAVLMLVGAVAVPLASSAAGVEARGRSYGEMVDYPLAFPVDGAVSFTDTFWASRSYPDPQHHAQDLMADKMTPVVAAMTGTVRYINWSWNEDNIDYSRCCTLAIRGDDGWETWYIHLNNDTPGTDDGKGAKGPTFKSGQTNPAWGIAPDIHTGTRVEAGQLIGWVGDSGNAENVSPHLHFELRDPNGVLVNPYEALIDARDNGGLQVCDGLPATIIGDLDGDGIITGTPGDDVIVGSFAKDVIDGRGGNDVICGLQGNDRIDGGPGDDVVFGGSGNDEIRGGSGTDTLYGGDGDDILTAGDDDDVLEGQAGKDLLRSGRGDNTLIGGGGRDTAVYLASSNGVVVDLDAGTGGADTLFSVENVIGSRYDDVIVGNEKANRLKGERGDDTISGADGDDRLLGGKGTDEGDGGDGSDRCTVETPLDCEA